MADHRRTELAGFLRSRRDRVMPADVGLPSKGQRRTPGLRREEVALLSGVGVTWYTWLEQGRRINVSEQVLNAVADALLLNPDERRHLLSLAGVTAPKVEPVSTPVTETHLAILEQLLPHPACIQTTRFDVLAYNRTYRHLITDMENWPEHDRNCAVMNFLDPRWEQVYEDYEHVAASIVARLRSSMAHHFNDPSWLDLVNRLRRESTMFDDLWNRKDVQTQDNRVKGFRNPYVGLLKLWFTRLWLDSSCTVYLIPITPADERTTERLIELNDKMANDPPVSSRDGVGAAAA